MYELQFAQVVMAGFPHSGQNGDPPCREKRVMVWPRSQMAASASVGALLTPSLPRDTADN